MAWVRPRVLDLSGVPRLPLRVPLGKHEIVISVLNRQAARSGFSSMSELLSRTPNLPSKGRYTMSELVSIASRVNGCDEVALARSSIARIGSSFELEGVSVLSGRFAVQGRVCVGCLLQDAAAAPARARRWAPYLRDWWQVAQIGGCPEHNMILLGICPGCSEPFDLRRPLAARCCCGQDLLASAKADLSPEHVEADAYLLGRLGRWTARSVPLLDGLSFGSAAGLMLNIGGSLDPELSFNRTWNVGCDRSRYGSVGHRVLEQGWEAFDRALGEMREIATAGRRHSGRLVGTYGRLQYWLNVEKAPDLEPFRSRLLAYAAANAPVAASTRIFGVRLENAERMTMNAAAKLVGRQPGPIYAVLKALGMEHQATGRSRADLITAAAVDRVRREFAQIVDSADAQAILGCTRDQLHRFARSGIVRKFCDGTATSTGYYRRSSVERVASILMDGLATVTAVPDDMVLLENANRLARLGKDAALRAALNGEIRPRALLAGSEGGRCIRNVLINRDDLRQLARRSGSPGYTLAEAARVLRMSRLTVGKAMGVIAPGQGRRRLSARDIRAIRERFATVREIAAASPDLRSRAGMTAALAARGIRPVLDDAWVNPIFDRQVVGAVLGAIPIEALPGDFPG